MELYTVKYISTSRFIIKIISQKMSKFKICYKSGFTLLEIVFAMLIISLTLAGILGLYVTSQKFVSQAGRRLQALK